MVIVNAKVNELVLHLHDDVLASVIKLLLQGGDIRIVVEQLRI